MTAKAQEKPAAGNGAAPAAELSDLEQAIAYEQQIATEAATIRAAHTGQLDHDLFLQLWPLLKRPIPQAFIVSTGISTGKPYESTGVKSLQVLIERMDNVLTPLWWWYDVAYVGGDGFDGRLPHEGKLAEATVYVGRNRDPETAILKKVSRGGINQASTIGNLYKGTETNAAKRAFAQVGPGHEVYLGATDLDPDVNEEVADAQAAPAEHPAIDTISADSAAKLRDTFDQVAGDDVEGMTKKLKVKLGAIGVTARSVNQGLAQLTPAQAIEIDGWLSEQAPAEQPKDEAK